MSLTTWRWRPCRTLRCSVAPGFPWRRAVAAGRAFARGTVVFASILAGFSAGVGLVSAAAMAQRSPVTVDLGALDALGPENPAANPGSRIRLHLPDRPSPSRKTEPVRAETQRPAAAKPQANAVAPTPNLPPPPPPPPNIPPSSTSAALTPARPAPAPAPSPPAAETHPAPTAGEGAEHILFQPDDANLPADAKQELDRLASRLSADGKLHVQLVAYAGGSGDASQARRLSLSRALAARSYLVDRGVDIKQIDVRPLGNKSEPGAPADRIDLVVAQR
jgi:outer membrane protein OmpA-like peptidoglycan-associated protein